jgi:hypothetical protein
MLATGLSTPILAGPFDAWTKYRTVTINTTATGGGANVAATVTNFPVLVRLTSASVATGANVLSTSLAGGADLRFTDATGDSTLAYEIESWTTAAAAIWVKVPLVTGNANTIIRMYWRRPSQTTTSAGAAVFDTAGGFVGVWHMGGVATVPDATANGLTGTNVAGVATVVGVSGPAHEFNGSDHYISVANDARLNITQNLTLSAWIYSTDWTLSRYVLNKGTGQGTTSTSLQYAIRDNTSDLVIFETGTGANSNVTMPNPATGQWLLLHATHGGGQGRIYLNGTLVNSTNNSANLNTTTSPLVIGWSANQTSTSAPNWHFLGSIDEVRIQRVLRDSNWIKLDYALSRSATTAVTLGPTQGLTVPDAPTAVLAAASGAAGSGQVTISWTAPALNGGAAVNAYTVTSSPGTGTCNTTGALTCNVTTGLTAGTAYTFTVRATNSEGVGPASLPSAAVTPPTVGLNPGSLAFRVSGNGDPYTFQLPATAIASTEKVTLSVLDTYGRAVWSRSIRPSAHQTNEITWDGITTQGLRASAGIYLVRVSMQAGSKVTTLTEETVTLKP